MIDYNKISGYRLLWNILRTAGRQVRGRFEWDAPSNKNTYCEGNGSAKRSKADKSTEFKTMSCPRTNANRKLSPIGQWGWNKNSLESEPFKDLGGRVEPLLHTLLCT